MPISDELANLTAIVLAGGKGTRLRSVVSDCPKVLAQVCSRPFLFFLLEQLYNAGIRNTVFCTGYMAEMVEGTCGKSFKDMKISYSMELEPLGTGGAILNALPLVETEAMLVMNGDSYCALDMQAFYGFFIEKSADIAIAAVMMEDSGRYGSLSIRENSKVSEFIEKKENAGPGFINSGIYLLKKSFLAKESSREMPVSLERDIFQKYHDSIYAFKTESAFIDIGTPESFEASQNFFKNL